MSVPTINSVEELKTYIGEQRHVTRLYKTTLDKQYLKKISHVSEAANRAGAHVRGMADRMESAALEAQKARRDEIERDKAGYRAYRAEFARESRGIELGYAEPLAEWEWILLYGSQRGR